MGFLCSMGTGAAQGIDQQAATRNQIRSLFEKADADGNGVISPEELSVVMQGIWKGITEQDVELLFTAVDKDSDGQIQYQEFLDWVLSSGAGQAPAFLNKAEEGDAEVLYTALLKAILAETEAQGVEECLKRMKENDCLCKEPLGADTEAEDCLGRMRGTRVFGAKQASEEYYGEDRGTSAVPLFTLLLNYPTVLVPRFSQVHPGIMTEIVLQAIQYLWRKVALDEEDRSYEVQSFVTEELVAKFCKSIDDTFEASPEVVSQFVEDLFSKLEEPPKKLDDSMFGIGPVRSLEVLAAELLGSMPKVARHHAARLVRLLDTPGTCAIEAFDGYLNREPGFAFFEMFTSALLSVLATLAKECPAALVAQVEFLSKFMVQENQALLSLMLGGEDPLVVDPRKCETSSPGGWMLEEEPTCQDKPLLSSAEPADRVDVTMPPFVAALCMVRLGKAGSAWRDPVKKIMDPPLKAWMRELDSKRKDDQYFAAKFLDDIMDLGQIKSNQIVVESVKKILASGIPY